MIHQLKDFTIFNNFTNYIMAAETDISGTESPGPGKGKVERKNGISALIFKILLITTFFFALLFSGHVVSGSSSTTTGSDPVINEIMTANLGTTEDDDGDFSDWIELFNPGDQSVNLVGYGLSDDYDRPFRWVFPDVTLEPGEYLLVWASGKDRSNASEPLHTNFAISSDGEEVLITEPGGRRVGDIPPVPIPGDISYGRTDSGNDELAFFSNPTPGYANHHESYQGVLAPPVLTLPTGFYQGTQEIEITHADSEAVIRYTLDNSFPGETGALYGGPVRLESLEGSPNFISEIRTNPPEVPASIEWYPPAEETAKAHVLRAAAYRPGYIASAPVSGTYFVDLDTPALPVFSIVTDDDNLFDHDSGIYVPGIVYEQNGYGEGWYGQPNANYYRRGIEWEVPAQLEFIENGKTVLGQEVGIRIHGGGTRALPMKSLRLYARGSYGNTHLRYDFFPDQVDQQYKRLILRNSGQDFFGYGTMFRDGFMHKLVEPLGWDIQDYRPAIVFLNGEYWGIHNIRERYDENYFERKYGIAEEDLDFLESNQLVRNGSADHYSEMISFVEHNPLSEQDAFSHLASLMDIDNYIDFFIVNIFFNNIDWPGHNLKYWRYSGEPYNNPAPGRDGRWRWAFNDFDFGFGNNEGLYPYNQNTLEHATHPDGSSWPPNPPWSTFLIRSLLENDGFRSDFINRFGDLLNSLFRPEYMAAALDEMKAALEPEILRHIKRWGHPAGGLEDWEGNISRMESFAERRPDHQVGHILNYFELPGTFTLHIDVNDPAKGTVMVNKLLVEEGGIAGRAEEELFPWTGTYFRGVPVPVAAVPDRGFEFIKWVSDSGEEFFDNPLPVASDENVSLTAVFGEQTVFFPEPWRAVTDDLFHFTRWNPEEQSGSYPTHMAFIYMDSADPGPQAGQQGYTDGAYNLETRTRINGLGCGGLSFINTGNDDGNPGYPGGRLGGLLMAMDTRDAENINIMFTAATVSRNSRIYNIRLQYRLGDYGEFSDLLTDDDEIIEYLCNVDGHSRSFGPFSLPEDLHGRPYLQLLWRYYYTGEREDPESGQRSELRLGSIAVFQGDSFPGSGQLPDVYIEEPESVICDNDTSVFTAHFSSDEGHPLYNWYIDDNLVLSGNDKIFMAEKLSDGAKLRVEADDLNSCLPGFPAVSEEIELTVFPSPQKPEITQEDSTLVSSETVGNQWYGMDAGMIQGAVLQEFEPQHSDSYFVIVTDGQCFSGPSDTVEFILSGNRFSPDISGFGIMVYPNPAGAVLNVRIENTRNADTRWEVHDPVGIRVLEGVASGQEFMLDISRLTPGIYFLKLGEDSNLPVIKFIKHR